MTTKCPVCESIADEALIVSLESQLTTLKAQLAERDDRIVASDIIRKALKDSLEQSVKHIAALSKRNGELTEGLKRLEWVDKGVNWQFCPACGRVQQWATPDEIRTHETNCWLNALIQGGEGEE